MDEEEKELKRIQDEGFDLISRNATQDELSNFFETSLKKLTRPSLIKKFEEYKITLNELNQILH